MCSFWWQKCGLRPKLFLLLHLFSTFRGVHTLIFTYVPHVVIGLYKEPANFYREKRSISFVTGHLFTFVLVLSFICLVTPQILICENQTVKTKDIKKRAWIISQKYKWSWKMKVTNILLEEQHLMPDYAHPAHPPSHKHTHAHTHQQKGHCLLNEDITKLMDIQKKNLFLAHFSNRKGYKPLHHWDPK